MGSFFAGIKAGTLSGVLYVGVMAVFNVILLYALKPTVLGVIQHNFSSICSPAPVVNGTSVEDCFASVVAVDVPYIAFVAFFISLLYSGLFGMYYDIMPGRNPTLKGEAFGAIVAASLLLTGFSGFYFDSISAYSTTGFLILWTIVFGYVLGRLYRKYTRPIRFESEDPKLLRILVDGRDLTGKERTFAVTSNHKLRAEVSDDASFKEWQPVGGVALEDNRSFETTMEIGGQGSLKGVVGKKY